jgi:hypothetical protein
MKVYCECRGARGAKKKDTYGGEPGSDGLWREAEGVAPEGATPEDVAEVTNLLLHSGNNDVNRRSAISDTHFEHK